MRQTQWSLLLIGMLFIGMIPLSAAASPPSKGTHKLIVQSTDAAALKTLAQNGGKLLVDYGSFSLWQAPEIQSQSVTGRDSVKVRDDLNTIHLRGATLDTTTGTVASVATNAKQTKSNGKQFWMVQFVGPVKGTWLDTLKRLGIEIVGYVPNNAYVIWLDGGALLQLESLAKTDPTIQWTGEYHPQYRLAPQYRGAKAPQSAALTPVTVQFYNTSTVQASITAVRTLGGTVFRQPQTILNLVDISLELPASQIVNVANRTDVFNVEPYIAPKKKDEAQGQIVAGNVTNSGGNIVPTGANYLTFLNNDGFPTDPAQYPIVAVVDDGVDNGTSNPLHPDFHVNGVGAQPSRVVASVNCTTDAAADGMDGHGNINAGIIGGFNNLTGAAYEDTNGYNYGLGISPYGRIANVKIFRNNNGPFDESQCGGTDQSTVLQAYLTGAAITSNSWGSNVAGAYDAEARAYDILTRDGAQDAAHPGNQQMLHVFAAGNAGPSTQTVGSPGTAKNVLTVAATENVRDNGVVDGCGISASNSADNIADYSSRGPAADGRTKPDIAAPGTHIEGPASQDPAGFDGLGVCGASGPPPASNYYPSGQTLYTWSSGTSHSTPAVAGVASLVYNYYQRVIKPGQAPSPAMTKALILNNPRYLTGLNANDTLPSPTQGWGDANLKAIFDATTHRYVVDQATTFASTGETYIKAGTVTDGSKPLKVTLVWTDAPGTTTASTALVNDLNLEVTVGGQTYKGNVFSGQWSTPGGNADAVNNVENVFISSLSSGQSFSVKVTAATIAGMAIPGGPGNVNQDFALVISNADMTPSAAISLGSISVSDPQPTGNNNGVAEPNETISLAVGITNGGDAPATGVTGTLSSTGAITLTNATASYGTIASNATATGTPAFSFVVAPTQVCGQAIPFSVAITYNSGQTATITFSIPTGIFVLGSPSSHAYAGGPIAIPDYDPSNPQSASVPVTVSGSGIVAKLRVTVNITHTWDGDLTLDLVAPNNASISLSIRNGSSGDNYVNTVFDDDATTSILGGSPPYTGTFKPEQPLSNLNGAPVNGVWKLVVQDHQQDDIGTINGFSLEITPRIPFCQTVDVPPPSRGGTTQPTVPTPVPPGRSGGVPAPSGSDPPAPAPPPRP